MSYSLESRGGSRIFFMGWQGGGMKIMRGGNTEARILACFLWIQGMLYIFCIYTRVHIFILVYKNEIKTDV